MKNQFVMLFAVIIIVLTISTTVRGNRMAPSTFHGACSTRLMNNLRAICGHRGITMLRNILIMKRYRKGRFRRNGAFHRRGRRDINRDDEYVPKRKPLSFEEAISMSGDSSLSSILTTGGNMHSERKVKRRVRRQISTECCKNDCNMRVVRERYCNFRYR